MKKVFTIVILLCFSVISYCQTVSKKRGIGGDLVNTADLQAATNLQWYYNWDDLPNPTVASTVQNYLEFVPIRWGAAGDYNKQELISYLTAHPEVDYILGFNEPNFIEQANLTPSQAAALWPEIEEIANMFNLKIVGPALNFCYAGGAVIENGVEYIDPIKYYDDFFAQCPNCRVDYIAIHGYFDHPNGLSWYLDLFRKYNKPMWMTEFNQSASWTTPVTQREYLVDALSILEKDPAVFRYAWFLTRAEGINSSIFTTTTTGELNELGLIYTNMSSYDNNYYHSISKSIQAEHWADRSGVYLEKTSDLVNGILNTYSMDANDWLEYNVDIPQSTQYTFSFRVSTTQATAFQVFSNNSLAGTIQIPATGNLDVWNTIKGNVNLPQGKQKIKIVPSTNAFGLKLNWFNIGFTQCHFAWSSTANYNTGWVVSYIGKSYKATQNNIGKTPGTTGGNSYWSLSGLCGSATPTSRISINEETEEHVKLYPNPSNSGVLFLETDLRNYSVEMFDIQGKIQFRGSNLDGIYPINTSGFEKGSYLIKVTGADKILHKRIIIE